MRSAVVWLGPIICAAVLLRPAPPLGAQARDPIALSGQVTSAEEGPMEGVLVSAKESTSTITITVVSDREGRYRFPESRLEARRIRDPHPRRRLRSRGRRRRATVTRQRVATVDLRLQKTRDLASQLTNADWFASFPGTEAQKGSIRGCTHCHTLERIVRTRYDADRMMAVIERMATYPQLSFPFKIQKLPAPRIGGGQDSPEQRRAAWRRQAEYLTTINLSARTGVALSAEDAAAAEGRATQVIYTEYDLPQRTRQPHDVIVDSGGLAWYASFGEQILGTLDPRTGKRRRVSDPDVEAGGADRDPRRPLRPGREPLARHAVSGRHREVRSPHGRRFRRGACRRSGTVRTSRSTRSARIGPRRRQGLAAGCRHVHGAAARRRIRRHSRCSSRTGFRGRTSTT